MSKIKFNSVADISFEMVRTLIIEKLKDSSFNCFSQSTEQFQDKVEFKGNMQHMLKEKFVMLVHEVLWEFIIQRIITPGKDSSNISFPWFRVTEYGKKVLASGESIPHDPTNYLEKYKAMVGIPDTVAFEYLKESLRTFNSGCYLAATMMLGIASERIFLTLCNVLLQSLSNQKEKKKFNTILDKISMIAKFDFVRQKIESLIKQKGNKFPRIQLANLLGIFEFIRIQRNEVGHPQDNLQVPERDNVYVNLRIFPQYCKTVEEVKKYLNTNKV